MLGEAMCLDLDLDTDRINDFLRSKLEEIKSTNAQLEESLRVRREIAEKYQQEITKDKASDLIQIGDVSKKLCHGKYVIGVGIRNESESTLENIGVILDWDSSSPLVYKYHLVSSKGADLLTDALKWTNHLESSGKIVIVMDAPFFTDRLSYAITGSINFQQKQKKIALELPVVRLTSDDITDNSIIAQIYKIIDGNIDDFLACARSCERHDFVMIVPSDRPQSVETALEVDCSFRKLNLSTDRQFFIAHKVCPPLEGALLEVEVDELNHVAYVTIYCRERSVLVALIHYLHGHIVGVVVVPRSLYRPDLSLIDATEMVNDSLSREISRLEEFSGGDFMDLRMKMMDLEHQSDVLMARINEELK